jgi:hypothetical protein
LAHVPFILTARLQTQLAVTRPIHIDGVLLAARERLHGEVDRAPLDCVAADEGVYRASAGLMVASGLTGASIGSQTRVFGIKLDGVDMNFIDCGDETPESERRPTKNKACQQKYRSQQIIDGIQSVSWTLLGDPDAVLGLTRAVFCIGGSANTGMGKVLSWEVEEAASDPEAAGWFAGGMPIRNLPAETVRRRLGAIHFPTTSLIHDRCTPPYWDAAAPRTLTVAPRLAAMIVSTSRADELLQAA